MALISVALDAGLEYDSNPNRALADSSDDAPRGSPLFRALGRGQFAYKGARQRLALGFAAGGKAFFLPQAADQHVGVFQFNYEHGAQLRRLRILGILDYYDSFQAPGEILEARRDLRTLSAGGRLVGSRSIRELHSIEGGLDLIGQYFEYKPDRELSFLSPSLLSRLGAHIHAGDPDLGHDFDLAVHARFDYRKYIGERQDLFVQLGTSLTWQGPLLVQLSYTGQLNISSLASETYQRHLILAKLAFRLPGDIYITGKSQLNLLQGAPGLFVPVGNIDDDNRSLAIFDLERPLRNGVALSARYTGYFSLPNETGAPYQRHTGYLGFTYNFRTVRRR